MASNAPSPEDPLFMDAVTWFVRQRDEAFGPEDTADFDRWLSTSDAHMAAYNKVRNIWSRTDAADAQLGALLEQIEAGDASISPEALPLVRRPRALPRWLAVAAALAILVTGYLVIAPTAPPRMTAYETSVGEEKTIALADGSTVELYAATEIEVGMSKTSRDVKLLTGEAYFNVTPDKDRPFRISAGAIDVEVVGTRFSVRRNRDDAVVEVSEGTVSVGADSTPVTLSAGDRVAYSAVSGLGDIEAADLAALEARRRGQFLFSETPLNDAVAELNRFYGPVFELTSPDLAGLYVNGIYRRAGPGAVAQALVANLPITANETADGRVLLSPGGGATPDDSTD